VRVGYLFVSAAIAGAVGGLLAFGIGHMDGVAGMHGWRWILIIEGMPTFFLGIATFFLLPNDVESAYFLTEDEKRLLLARHTREYGMTASARKFSKVDMYKAFKDWKVWAFCCGQFGSDAMLYSKLPFFPCFLNVARSPDRGVVSGALCGLRGAVVWSPGRHAIFPAVLSQPLQENSRY
jgi:MFS family permease